MKRIILVLALLLIASPAFATVTIVATPKAAPNGNLVDITYTSDEPNAIRGLALDITVVQVPSSQGAPTITAVTPAVAGETIDVSTIGFGIFPGTITIDENGTITNTGSPVAEAADHADTKQGLDSNNVTIEMASLYDMDDAGTLKPGQTGTLCTLTVSHDCDLSIVPNNVRGGIVLNDGKYSQDPCETTRLAVNLTGATSVPVLFEVLPTCVISGAVGRTTNGPIPDVTLVGLPGTVVTSGGLYSATVPYGWSGTVTPTKTGYKFCISTTDIAQSRTYTNVTSDQTAQNFRLGSYGDATGDGRVRSADATAVFTLLTNYATTISGQKTIPNTSPYYDPRLDMTGDGRIRAADATAVFTLLTNYATTISGQKTVSCPHIYGPVD